MRATDLKDSRSTLPRRALRRGIQITDHAEIAFGIERLPRSKRRIALQARFDLICTELSRAPWTDAVSQNYGRIKAALELRGTRIEDFDGAIAAHALAAGATLVTTDLAHVMRVPGESPRPPVSASSSTP